MTNATISIPVDEDTAVAYKQASPEEKKKIQLLLPLRPRELLLQTDFSLPQPIQVFRYDQRFRTIYIGLTQALPKQERSWLLGTRLSAERRLNKSSFLRIFAAIPVIYGWGL